MSLFDARDPLARLVWRAVRGDRRAFTRLYRELHPLVARYIARRVDSRADAEELVAEVFRRVVEHLADFDPKRGQVRPWVLRIARNAVIDHYRARKRPVALEQVADGLHGQDEPLASLLANERLARVNAALAQAPVEVRQLIAMRYGDNLRHREIAELLGISEAAVRKRLSRALRDLRERTAQQDRASSPAGLEAEEVRHAI